MDNMPTDTDRHSWQRFYTALVQTHLASRQDGLLSPLEAGQKASNQARNLWESKFPNEKLPSWMP